MELVIWNGKVRRADIGMSHFNGESNGNGRRLNHERFDWLWFITTETTNLDNITFNTTRILVLEFTLTHEDLMKRVAYLLLIFFLAKFPEVIRAQENTWEFLPAVPVFEPLLGDPREGSNGVNLRTGKINFEGAVGSTLEFLQWRPDKVERWGWGIMGSGFVGLDSVNYSDYPNRAVTVNGNLVYDEFPEMVNDWYFGMYFSESSGNFSNRLEYIHVSSHLGDELFDYVPRFIYTRESFRFTSSYQPSDQFRLYAGLGDYPHMAPDDKRLFVHAGTEIYTGFSTFVWATTGRGYFTYDVKVKQEAGGVVNQEFQLGFQWKWKRDSRAAIRSGILYYNGNSEYGQFYLQNDNHWGFFVYFDP